MSKPVAFNYEILTDVKVRNEAKKQAEQINKLLRSSAEAVVDIGKRLNAIRASMTPAMFRAWIECEFRWQQSTAANYMQSARVFGDLDCLAKFQPSALITLARTNVPRPVVDKTIAAARRGEVITQSIVIKELKTDPTFAPTRKDAGLSRKAASACSAPVDVAAMPQTPEAATPSPATTKAAPVAFQPPPARSGPDAVPTIETLRRTLDAFSDTLRQIELEQADRDALANRFFELAVQLRTMPQRQAAPKMPVSPNPKAKGSSKFAKSARRPALAGAR